MAQTHRAPHTATWPFRSRAQPQVKEASFHRVCLTSRSNPTHVRRTSSPIPLLTAISSSASKMGCDSSKVAPLFALSSPNEATNPFLDLPADVHRLISDFTASRTLSYTCRRTWCVLQHRHLSVQANGPWGLDKLLAVAPQTHSLTVISGQMAPVAPGVFPGLRLSTLPLLADVRLHFAENRLDLGHLSALAALGDAAGLTTVSIDLRSNAVGHRGAQALACISRAPRLTAVALNLQVSACPKGSAQGAATQAAEASTITDSKNKKKAQNS